ncbi:kinase-like domain-containing protein [Clohesyomyces aquaticus]|uniref:Kinase-like domain-containing protein n=1 Tax=Clohesyomyces aquaticus TaxID=1231657 RepID=A0A1Y1Z8A7_9PLEO|nr:kinase-like domain-containing protein [Clohesyomyces aquaticus]
MSSLFRKPGDSSSSDSSSDDDAGEDTKVSREDLNLLSKVNTIDSTQSGSQPSGTRPAISRNNSQFRDLILHSLLEDKALREAAEHLGKDRNDPEVQEAARRTYRALCDQLSGPYDVDKSYASDETAAHRKAAREGIDALTRQHLPQIAAQAVNESQAIMSRPGNVRTITGLENVLRNIAPSLPSLELPLQGYPGLHTDRYVREFVELSTIGKGGYGKVYKVKHKLDDSFYAVKRIMVSPVRLQRIKEHGPKEMESMLDEVRALARFDHSNVVRYHNAWLEFTSGPTDVAIPTTALVPSDRLLENGLSDSFSGLNSFGNLSFGDPFDRKDDQDGLDVVFETSDASNGEDHTNNLQEEPQPPSSHSNGHPKPSKHRARRTSNATIATISSTHSQMSKISSAGSYDNEEIEVIPRATLPSTSDLSQSMMSNSDIPTHLLSPHSTGPILTLNVQMSLYDTNLAAFLSETGDLCHCFHPRISLSLLTAILSGVQYLHAQNVVHRDLKPANIFLSLSTARIPPSGSVDLASCTSEPCHGRRACLHVNPRIGDFGLVAALGNGHGHGDVAAADIGVGVAKPVGTEFYRPDTVSRVSEKLDVYSLGVVLFEMLCRFGTRMERIDALTHLRRGEFSAGFADAVGANIQTIIQAMVSGDENARWGCEGVKAALDKAVKELEMEKEK